MIPQTETNFIEQITGAQFRFIQSANGQITAVVHHPTGGGFAWFPDWEAKKVTAGVIRKQNR
jgi:hypothetical protein